MSGDGFTSGRFSGEGLACRRGGRLVFAGLHFSVAPGGALVLRGPNGSGKTTLLRLMSGLTPSSSGHMAWDGTPVDDRDAHAARLRFVTHLDAVKPALTIMENLAFWMALWSGKVEDTVILKAMEALDLQRLSAFPARLLSAGQRHRLALARLMVAPAPLWLLDEPGNALDDASLTALAKMIADHRARGGMVVVASHGSAFVEGGMTLDVGAFSPKTPAHWSEEEE
ncbi:MAG: heme ABC exporter ATP-binding protein CcmA [Rhodospirillaceae bacterium]|nr:heme ABC exporter ATP-binding protein CcmA [Rhodospirillaceae bacterium]